MHMVFKGELAVKLQAKDVKVGTGLIRNTRQDQVTMGRVRSPGFTNDKSLCFVRIQNHAPVITPLQNLAKSLLREAGSAGLSAGLQTTASSVELSAYAYGLFSTSSNISLAYRINRRGTNTLLCGMPQKDQDPLTHCTISHDSLPMVVEELSTNGQHTATNNTNRFQFEYETTVTHSVEGCTKVELS